MNRVEREQARCRLPGCREGHRHGEQGLDWQASLYCSTQHYQDAAAWKLRRKALTDEGPGPHYMEQQIGGLEA